MPGLGTVHGTVLDAALVPVAGATVRLGDRTTTPSSDGTFTFEDVAPGNLTLHAAASGFIAQTRTGVLHPGGTLALDVRLARQVIERPPEVFTFQGFIDCYAVVAAGHSHGPNGEEGNEIDCGAPEGQANVWVLDVDAGIQGILFEIAWNPETEFGTHMRAILELGHIELPEPIVFQEGSSVLRIQLTRLQALTYFEQAGATRLTIATGSGLSDASNEVALGLHIDQPFDIYATVFYDEPVPIGYSFLDP